MSLVALREALLDQGGTLADALGPPPEANAGSGGRGGWAPDSDQADARAGAPQLAARGPRARGHERDYELLLEMILEGSLLHYGSARLVHCADRDLALLLGDQLYALGLARLSELGDVDAVAELADLISLLAEAQAAADAPLADAIWQAGAAAIGWGATPEHAAAKALARAGDRGAVRALTGARDAVLAAGGGAPS